LGFVQSGRDVLQRGKKDESSASAETPGFVAVNAGRGERQKQWQRI
jgi:hypothetical protein